MTDTPGDAPPILYCANHPNIETGLRCNNCGKPICPKCAVLTPTGYRCRECVRGQQRLFETALWYDYPLVILTAGGLAFLGSLIVSAIGFFTIFVAPIFGVIIAEAARWITRRRRSNRLFLAAAIAAALGSLLPVAVLLTNLLFLGGGLGSLLPLVWQGLYVFTITPTVLYRLRGIQMR